MGRDRGLGGPGDHGVQVGEAQICLRNGGYLLARVPCLPALLSRSQQAENRLEYRHDKMPGKEKMFENANVRETRETETPPSSELEAGF